MRLTLVKTTNAELKRGNSAANQINAEHRRVDATDRWTANQVTSKVNGLVKVKFDWLKGTINGGPLNVNVPVRGE